MRPKVASGKITSQTIEAEVFVERLIERDLGKRRLRVQLRRQRTSNLEQLRCMRGLLGWSGSSARPVVADITGCGRLPRFAHSPACSPERLLDFSPGALESILQFIGHRLT